MNNKFIKVFVVIWAVAVTYGSASVYFLPNTVKAASFSTNVVGHTPNDCYSSTGTGANITNSIVQHPSSGNFANSGSTSNWHPGPTGTVQLANPGGSATGVNFWTDWAVCRAGYVVVAVKLEIEEDQFYNDSAYIRIKCCKLLS